MRFYGIKETGSKHQREDCEAVVLAKLQDTYPEVNSRSFERVHRLGPPKQGYSRPIIARMGHHKDKMMLFARRKILKEKTGISISDDFPKEIEEKRMEMYPIYRHAQETGYNTQLKGDKLFVNGRVYTPETLQQLPPVLRPELVFSPSQNGITAFFTKASPLSNHFITNFSVDNEVFNCVEQFLMKQKAMFFKDTETATKIMRENDPVRQKALGKTVKNYQDKEWKSAVRDIIKIGLSAKFKQNKPLRDFLMATGTTTIVEANKNDSYFGIGLGLWDKQVWDMKKHKGHNVLGQELMAQRDELKSANY